MTPGGRDGAGPPPDEPAERGAAGRSAPLEDAAEPPPELVEPPELVQPPAPAGSGTVTPRPDDEESRGGDSGAEESREASGGGDPGAGDPDHEPGDRAGDERTAPPTAPSTQPMTAPSPAAVRHGEPPVFDIDSWMDAPPGTIPGLTDGILEDDLDRVFAAERFHEYPHEPVLPLRDDPTSPDRASNVALAAGAAQADPVLAGVSPYGMPPDEAPLARPPRTTGRGRMLIWGAGVAVAVLALVAVFVAGRAVAGLASPSEAASARPSVSPSARAAAIPTALAAPGVQPWSRLAGGECIDGFSGAWAETFTVVDCGRQHTGQLLLRAPFPDAKKAPYPGITVLEQRMPALCSAPGVADLGRAGAASDLQISSAFPATRRQWEDGERDYFCFVSRSSGAPISGSVAGPAQATVWAARTAPTATVKPSPSAKKR